MEDTGSQRSEDQLEAFIFNVKGYAQRHNVTDRGLFQKITAYEQESQTLFAHFEKEKIAIPVTEITLTEQEQDEPEPNQQAYLWVGMIFVLNGEALPSPSMPAISEGEAVDEDEPDHETLDIVPSSQRSQAANLQTIRVVSPIKKNVQQVQYFGLVDRAGGLCRAFMVDISEIFFFAEFRDSSTSVIMRETKWSELVKEYIEGLMAPAKAPEGGFHPVAVPPEEPCMSLLRQYASALTIVTKPDARKRLISKLKAQINNVDPDVLSHLPNIQQYHFDDFLDYDGVESVTEGLAEDVVRAAESMWSVKLDKAIVFLVGNEVRKEPQMPVSYKLLRPFLVFCNANDRLRNHVRQIDLTDVQLTNPHSMKNSSENNVRTVIESRYRLTDNGFPAEYESQAALTNKLEKALLKVVLQYARDNLDTVLYNLRLNDSHAKEQLGADITKISSVPEILSAASQSMDAHTIETEITAIARRVYEEYSLANEKQYKVLDEAKEILEIVIEALD